MNDFRPPEDGPSWPERDLPGEEQGEESWLERDSTSDSPHDNPAEPPAEPEWAMPWERPAEEPVPEDPEPWPVFEPRSTPHWGDAGGEEAPGDRREEAAEADTEPAAWPAEPAPWSDPAASRDDERGGEQIHANSPDEPAAREDEPPVDDGPAAPQDEPPAESWPAEDDEEPPADEPAPVVPALGTAPATTAFEGGGGWDPRLDGERRRPTTAEQAVPWMIGVILALAGMVIVLLALIFTFPGGLTGSASPTPTPSGAPSAAESQVAVVSAEPSATDEPTATPVPTPEPTAVPEYGPLEMVYLGRPSALAPIYLLRRDFSVNEEATIMAQAEQGISAYAWSPDGRFGAAIIAGRAVALEPGSSARALADDVSALSWGWDSETLYAVRISRDGANDSAEILQIDFASADVETLATITYPHPVTAPDAKLKEAQFVDDGGLVRLYAVADGNLVLWVLGAPATYRIDPGDGSVTEAAGQPVLWSPDGRQRISLSESGSTTTITLLDAGEKPVASVQATGLVSHVRWAPSNNEIVFTLGHLSNAGGVRQDLYVWDLTDGKAPMAMTSNGVSFGASWVGVSPDWMPPRS